MTPLAIQDVARLALAAGFAPNQAAVATALACAESGLRPAAIGDVALENAKWGPSVGLWQIRTLKAEKGRDTFRDEDWLLADVAHQATAAYAISGRGSNFAPWSTYTSLAYVPFMTKAQNAVAAMLKGTQPMPADPSPPIVSAFPTPTGKGYWLVSATGDVFAFGDAPYLGGLAVSPSGGYEAVGRPE